MKNENYNIFSSYFRSRCFPFIEAKAEILGSPDLYIMSGSSLRLVCRLQGSTQAPLFVFWYHSDRMINFDTDRGLIVHINSTESDLIMPYTNTSDSGNYTCQPQNISPATIHVHVLQCEYYTYLKLICIIIHNEYYIVNMYARVVRIVFSLSNSQKISKLIYMSFIMSFAHYI